MISPYFRQPGLWLALMVYLGLALAYFFIVPIFEAPDEWTHTGHVRYIAQGNGLPVMLPGRGIWGGQQPPLYYVTGALLMLPFDLDDFDDYEPEARNPHASLGYALDPGNKNNYLHSPAENFPYQGLSLAVHALRLYSISLGLAALLFVYLTALELWAWSFPANPVSRSPWLFAAAVALFVASQPMYGFITASVANEPANITFCAVSLWLAQRYVLRGPGRRWGRAAVLGISLGLAALSKMTGLAVGLVVVVAFLITAISTRKIPGAARRLWRDSVIIGLLFLAVAGWWYWRNYQLYGDFFQKGLYKLYFNVEPQPLSLGEFLYTLSTGEISFWATFGWLNTVAPDWVYSFYRIFSRVGLVGLGLALVFHFLARPGRRVGNWGSGYFAASTGQHLPWPGLLLHLVFPLALAFSLTRLVATEGGMQGRQMLPALGSLAILIIAGWWVLASDRVRLPVLASLAAVLVGLAVWLPFVVVAPVYTPPPLLTEASLPGDLARLDLTFRDEMKLIGVKIGAEQVQPGQRVPVTAYWQALKPMDTNYSVFVHLVGRDYQVVGQMNTYPGLGLRPTRTLSPGQIVADTYPVLVEGGSAAPTRLLVNIGLFDIRAEGRPGIPGLDPAGRPVSSTAGQLKLIPAQWPALPPPPPVAEFSDQISLGRYSIEGCQTQSGPCLVVLTWLALGRPAADYTVFIQLWPAAAQVRAGATAGFDGPPLAGDYPTGLWEAGEVIIDPHRLDLSLLPPGEYRLLAGLYNALTGDRLPAAAGGEPLPDYAVDLGPIQVR